ncbi:MAG: response regulator transcription factor [Arcobacter sp.]|uniref:response regulator transcription factor n=1 Tax=Arcobacter sp. TaxID=1872629 RepID=UPI003D11AF90
MNNLNLLYVEDDEETVESIDFFLKRHFKEIYLAQDGEQALSFFEKKDPDIIILDINIPKLNGIKLATKIREKNKKVPIIFLTAYSDKDNLLQAIHLHAFSYLIKPFKINELIETIDKCKKELLCEHTNPNLRKLSENLIWNKLKKELYFNKEKVSLTKNELSLINLFVENDFKFFTPEEINEYIFLNHDLKNNSIIQLISRLKKKITEITSDSEFFIENIYNKGYRLK